LDKFDFLRIFAGIPSFAVRTVIFSLIDSTNFFLEDKRNSVLVRPTFAFFFALKQELEKILASKDFELEIVKGADSVWGYRID
jgi:hypothetical protein